MIRIHMGRPNGLGLEYIGVVVNFPHRLYFDNVDKYLDHVRELLYCHSVTKWQIRYHKYYIREMDQPVVPHHRPVRASFLPPSAYLSVRTSALQMACPMVQIWPVAGTRILVWWSTRETTGRKNSGASYSRPISMGGELTAIRFIVYNLISTKCFRSIKLRRKIIKLFTFVWQELGC